MLTRRATIMIFCFTVLAVFAAAPVPASEAQSISITPDLSCGGSGGDTLNGNFGDDTIGESGNDDIHGESNDGHPEGGSGLDHANGGPVSDSCEPETVTNSAGAPCVPFAPLCSELDGGPCSECPSLCQTDDCFTGFCDCDPPTGQCLCTL